MRLDRVVAAVVVGVLVGLAPAGVAQAATAAKDRPGKPTSDERPGKPSQANRPTKPVKPAKGAVLTDDRRTQTVFTCSYVCPEDGSPCAWAVRAETRPLPVPAPVEDQRED